MRRTSVAHLFNNPAAARRSGFTLLEVLVAAVVAAVTLSLVAALLGNATVGFSRIENSFKKVAALRELERILSAGEKGIPQTITAAGVSWRISVAETPRDSAWMLIEADSDVGHFRLAIPSSWASGGTSARSPN